MKVSANNFLVLPLNQSINFMVEPRPLESSDEYSEALKELDSVTLNVEYFNILQCF